MKATKYVELGTDWQTDSAIECCTKDPADTPQSCDCCYDGWVIELKKVKLDYTRAKEKANQLSDHYRFVSTQRDKLKAWLDDLVKADQLARAVCDQLEITSSHSSKICTNSGKSVESIEILFCMVRDIFEQADYLLTVYNQIDNCIRCLNSPDLPENSGIRKCLKLYLEKLEAVIKTRNELLKAMIAAIKIANILHEEICSDYGLVKIIEEWQVILNCDEKCGGDPTPCDPCKDQAENNETAVAECKLIPILTLPVCNDPYYAWVKTKYDQDVAEANDLGAQLVAANKIKESLAACQSSLIAAIKEVNPKELCK
ncbi:MAG: hypothetical protein H7Y27_07780 [Gemmatimonadaceae bacterium]|nr:hypothetical protein [Chitinophagaceae bacterium]